MDISPVCKTCGTTLSHLIPKYREYCNEIYSKTNGIPYSTNILTSNIITSDTVDVNSKQLIDFLEANLPNGEALLCCRTTFLTHMDRQNPYGEVSNEGILDRNNDVVEELELLQ